MDKSNCRVIKVFRVMTTSDHYYVQRMPDNKWGGFRYVVMLDRRRLSYRDFTNEHEAIKWLLNHIYSTIDKQMALFREQPAIAEDETEQVTEEEELLAGIY